MTLQIDTQRLRPSESLLEHIAEQIDFADAVASEPDQLGEWLEKTLTSELGLATITRDEDDDIPISLGGPVVYVRQGGPGSSFVTVLALLLEDFDVSPCVYEAVNVINLEVPMAKTVVDADIRQIVMSIELPVIDSLSPDDLMLAVETVSDWAEYFDTLLQSRFGGATSRDS
jgi:type III secretion system-like peptide-binding chaperone